VTEDLDQLDDEALEALCVMVGMKIHEHYVGTKFYSWQVRRADLQEPEARYFFRVGNGVGALDKRYLSHSNKHELLVAALEAYATGVERDGDL